MSVDKHTINRRASFIKQICGLLEVNFSKIKLTYEEFLSLFDVKTRSYDCKDPESGSVLAKDLVTLTISEFESDDLQAAIFKLVKTEVSDVYAYIVQGHLPLVIDFGGKVFFVARTKTIQLLLRMIKYAKMVNQEISKVKTATEEAADVIASELDKGTDSLEKLIKFFGEEKVLDHMIKKHETGITAMLKNSKNPNVKAKIKESKMEVFS